MKFIELMAYSSYATVKTLLHEPIGIILEKGKERKFINFNNFTNQKEVIEKYCEDFTVDEMCRYQTKKRFLFNRMSGIFIIKFIKESQKVIPNELIELLIDSEVYI